MTVLTAAIFWRHLFQSFTFPWDFTATSRWAVFLTSSVAGNFSEWVPFVGGGFPVAECAVCGLFSPLWWAMGALHIPATVGIQTWIQVLHVLLGSAGVLVLARSYGMPWRWALLAATSFTFFGGLYGNASHDVILRGHTYAPWVLWTLTIPPRWAPYRRIVALPALVWVVGTAGYPGQAIAFLLVGGVYLLVQLRLHPDRLRNRWPLVLPALLGSVAVLGAAYLPYLVADSRGELFRPYPPAAQERSIWSLHLMDLFGLYLNPFAWKRDAATIAAWSVGVVVLMGVASLTRAEVRRHLPLATAGTLAALLAFLPSWGPAGRAMAAIPMLFPSRLPASDYKAIVAVALAILGAAGWSRIADGGRAGPGPAIAAAVLAAGLILAPQSRSVPPAKLPLLVVGILAACVIVAYRGPSRWIFAAVLLLTVAEGFRTINDLEIVPGQKAWALAPEDFPQRELHDRQAVRLREQLDDPPATRPARTLPLSPDVPGGTAEDAIGYLGAEHRLGDYGGTITMQRHHIAEDERLTRLMLEPWTAWVIPCSAVDCTAGEVPLPGDLEEHRSERVQTTAYGVDYVDYQVNLDEPSLLVENEIPARGWSASRNRIRQVEVGGALRGWVLPEGSYTFTARYRQPERQWQLLLAALALAATLATYVNYRRKTASALP